MHSSRHGFTLVELSISVVIIALITGGVLTGKSVLRNGQLQSVVREMKMYEGAVMQFAERYNGLPGDFTNAESNWGTDPDGCPTNSNYLPHKATCNGDGNGQILGTNYVESFRAWQQLANAGLIDGSYSGVTGSAGVLQCVAGVNCPGSKMPDAVYWLGYFGTVSGNAAWFDGNYKNVIIMGGQPSTNSSPLNTIFTPGELYNIDLKIDDGRPGTGTYTARKDSATCSTTTDPTTAEYNVRSKARACALIHDLGI